MLAFLECVTSMSGVSIHNMSTAYIRTKGARVKKLVVIRVPLLQKEKQTRHTESRWRRPRRTYHINLASKG